MTRLPLSFDLTRPFAEISAGRIFLETFCILSLYCAVTPNMLQVLYGLPEG